jgi:hypothetical protein
MAFNNDDLELRDNLLWGAQAIADFIGRDVRDVYYLLQRGLLDADKCGDLWVSTRTRLHRQFNEGRAKAGDQSAERDAAPQAAPTGKRKRAAA